jgi:hypothetical protein
MKTPYTPTKVAAAEAPAAMINERRAIRTSFFI